MSATGYHIATSPYHVGGSLGGTTGTSAYSSLLKSTLPADSGASSRFQHAPVAPKLHSGLEPAKPAAYTGPDKYATVTASDIRHIVNSSLSAELRRAGSRLAEGGAAPDLQSSTAAVSTSTATHLASKSTSRADLKLDSFSSRPYSSDAVRAGIGQDTPGTTRALTADGSSRGLGGRSLTEHRTSTPYYGYDRLAGATVAALATDTPSSLAPSSFSSGSASPFLSDKACYNTHQKYVGMGPRPPSSDLDHHTSTSTSSSRHEALVASSREARGSEVGSEAGLSSHRHYAPVSRMYTDYKSLLTTSSEKPSSSALDVASTPGLTANSSRYLDTGLKMLAPSPPKVPHPTRTDTAAALWTAGADTHTHKETAADDLLSRSLSTSRLNGVNINSSFGRGSLASPREHRDALLGQTSSAATLPTSGGTAAALESLSRHISSAVDDLARSLPHSTPLPAKRSILKKASSYGPSESLRAEAPLLGPGPRREALPPLALSPRGAGTLRRPSSCGKRVTFNMGQNTSHWYEAAEYDEPHFNPYIW